MMLFRYVFTVILGRAIHHHCIRSICTVSHFSYAPLFKGQYFFTKMLESNILYVNLLIDIHVNHSATPKAILTKVHDCTCNLNVYIFYLRFALGIIHGERCDRKTPKTIILFK